jgi:hypothetical protein
VKPTTRIAVTTTILLHWTLSIALEDQLQAIIEPSVVYQPHVDVLSVSSSIRKGLYQI